MELKLVHVLGPVLALVAMFFYGQIMVGKSKGRTVRIMPALAMILFAILYRQFFGDGTFLDRICLTLMDFGIALIIDSAYLSYHKNDGRVFWVPGVLALIVSFGIYFVASLFGWTVAGLFDGDGKSDLKSGQILIELGPDDQISEIESVLKEFQAEYIRAFPHISLAEDEDLAQYYLVKLPNGSEKAFLTAIRRDKENIDQADYNFEVQLDLPATTNKVNNGPAAAYLASDPKISQQWWLPPALANSVHELLKNNPPKRKAKVAIIDTGVDEGHEDLNGVIEDRSGNSDENGHGTHCAGLAGANTNNGLGMASLNWEGEFIEIRSYKALDKGGHGTIFRTVEAITLAVEDGADIISLSLGSHRPKPPAVQVAAIKFALEHGCIVVAAAGNNGGEDARNNSPSNIAGVIAVAAIDENGHRASFSNINTKLDRPIAAPGANIYSTMPNGKYEFMSGTSMATPIVAGLLGVLRAYNPDFSAENAWKLLHETGMNTLNVNETGRMIDPLAAIRAILRQ